MRYATVVATALRVHAEPGTAKIVGHVSQGDRVKIVGGPIVRQRTWWQIEASDRAGDFRGWVAEGGDGVTWLRLDPPEREECEPLPPDVAPVDDRDDIFVREPRPAEPDPINWRVIGLGAAVIGVLLLLTLLASKGF